MSEIQLQILHDKPDQSVRILIYDTNLMVGFKLTPEQAEEIGRVGAMARTYREATK